MLLTANGVRMVAKTKSCLKRQSHFAETDFEEILKQFKRALCSLGKIFENIQLIY